MDAIIHFRIFSREISLRRTMETKLNSEQEKLVKELYALAIGAASACSSRHASQYFYEECADRLKQLGIIDQDKKIEKVFLSPEDLEEWYHVRNAE